MKSPRSCRRRVVSVGKKEESRPEFVEQGFLSRNDHANSPTLVDFAELKRKATEASKGAGASLAEKRSLARGPSSKYTPSGLDAPRQPTAAERLANSSVLNQAPPAHRPPPPPPLRRTTFEDSGAAAAPAKTAVPSRPTAPSARFGGSAPAAAPPAPPARKYGAQPPLPSRSSSRSSHSAPPPTPPRSVASPAPLPSTHRPIPAPPYQHAVVNDLPAASLPPRAPPARQVAATAKFKLFSQYGQEDKDEFFSMLDQFLETKLRASPSDAVPGQTQVPVLDEPAPPPVTLSTRPTLSRGTTSISAVRSYPPSQSHSSSALSVLHYILYEPYTTAWYSLPTPTPPPLVDRSDIRWTGSWTQSGDQKSLVGICLFGDCSIAWWKLGWSASEEKRGQLDPSRMTREGRYRPIPAPWDGERLYAASEMYGPLLVAFVNRAVASRRPVARGECWDVAAEALNSVATSLPKPFPSIGRTHGQLIFYGKAGGRNEGVWRGGDAYVRPGDIVEWRTVRIREVGMQAGSYSTLGDPDHTAVITAVGSPTSIPADGQPYPIAALVSLTVVEQSQGSLPVEKTYDLAAMSKGELWIYRPVGLVEFTGSEIAASWPPSCEAWQVGELE